MLLLGFLCSLELIRWCRPVCALAGGHRVPVQQLHECPLQPSQPRPKTHTHTRSCGRYHRARSWTRGRWASTAPRSAWGVPTWVWSGFSLACTQICAKTVGPAGQRQAQRDAHWHGWAPHVAGLCPRSPLAPHLHGTGSERRAWEGASGRAGACRHAAWCGSARPGSPMSEMGAVPGAAVQPGSSCPAPTMKLMLLTVTGLPCNAHVYGHVAIGQGEQQVPLLPSFTIFKVFVRYILHMKHLSSHNLFHNATLINYPELWCDTIVICHV